MAEIVVYQKGRRFFCVPLDTDHLTIGRSSQNDLILTGSQVSRQHIAIKKRDDGYWLEDLSTLGTEINGEKIDVPTKLENNGKIGIANWEIVFHDLSPTGDAQKIARQTQITTITSAAQSDATKILKFEHNTNSYRLLKPCLIINDPETGMRQHLVKKPRLVLGSSANCDIVLQDEFVSKYHAEFRLSDQGFHVTDLDSTNGTFVNNAKIRETHLKHDDEVRCGHSNIFVAFNEEPRKEFSPHAGSCFCGIYGQSDVMRLLYSKIQVVAETDMTCLILGETGTGKELVARAIHDLSNRRENALVVVNCGAISETLIESELFGHEKGAFTGADQRHHGAFEQANSGTIFLDEIGELPLSLQAKILRVLEYQTLRRVGGTQEIKVDVRILAATHRNLSHMVSEGLFREDLFYRLFVLPLRVPPLRERPEDITLLTNVFVERFANNKKITFLAPALAKMQKHSWPGNIRELKNTVLRTIAFGQSSEIDGNDIEFISAPSSGAAPPLSSQPSSPCQESPLENPVDRQAKEKAEIGQITHALKVSNGDKNAAALLLGLGRSTLFRKIKDYGIE